MFLAVICASCVTALLPPLADDAVTGEVTLARASDGSRYAIDRCVSGEHAMFHGFDLAGATDPGIALRAVVDPIAGPVVKLTTPAEEFVFRDRDCGALRIDVRPTGWRVNDARDFAGRVVMDCRAGNARVTADISIRACH